MHKALKPRLLFVVNVDWFFVSHRLALANACREAGYDVHVCAGETQSRGLIEQAGFEFHALPIDRGGTHPGRDLKTLRYLFTLYRNLRPSLVHHVTVKPVLYGGLAAKILRIPAVAAVSGLGYAFIPQEHEGTTRRLLKHSLKRLYKVALSSANCRVIFQNPADRDLFTNWKLVNKEKTVILPGSGVDLSRFVHSPLPHGPPIVLLPARLLWDKGVREFVKAAAIVQKKFPTARFALVGRLDSENPAAIKKTELDSWLETGAIEWWGAAASAEMPAIYKKATLVVLPSYREGLALVLPEAGATGRAVVTTDVPGCRDAIIPGQTGWLVPARSVAPLAAAIIEALEDYEELQRRSLAAYQLAKDSFRQEIVFEATISQYKQLGVPPLP